MGAKRAGLPDLSAELRLRAVLDPQLHQPETPQGSRRSSQPAPSTTGRTPRVDIAGPERRAEHGCGGHRHVARLDRVGASPPARPRRRGGRPAPCPPGRRPWQRPLSSTASKPSSIACAGVRPADAGVDHHRAQSGNRARRPRSAETLWRPCPEPIGAPRASAPRSPRPGAARPRPGPRWCRGTPGTRRRPGRAPPSTRPNTSGWSVSGSPITSSLIQGVPNTSRAMRGGDGLLHGVAAGGVGQDPHPQPAHQRPEPCPARVAPTAPQRDGDDLRPAACTAAARIAGDGYCAVPSSSREPSSVP